MHNVQRVQVRDASKYGAQQAACEQGRPNTDELDGRLVRHHRVLAGRRDERGCTGSAACLGRGHADRLGIQPAEHVHVCAAVFHERLQRASALLHREKHVLVIFLL